MRAFRQEQIAEEALQAVLAAGRAAPSGGNNRTTHLLVVQNPQVLSDLRALVEAEFAAMEVDEHTYKSIRNSVAASRRGGYEFFFRAPTLIVAANRKDYGNAMADSACVLENMMIAATALRVGSCWINQLTGWTATPPSAPFWKSWAFRRRKPSPAAWPWAIPPRKMPSAHWKRTATPSPSYAEGAANHTKP